MRVASEAEQQQVTEFGLKQMPMTQALTVLGTYLSVKDKPQVAAANVEWQTLKSAYEAKRPKPFLANVEDRQPSKKKEATKIEAIPQLQQQVAGRNAKDRRRIVMAQVKSAVAEVLGIDVNRLTDTQQGLFDMGMDSLMSVELKSHLETAVGQTLPSTLTFNYPTIDDLSEYLDTEILVETIVQDVESEPEVDAVTAVLSEVEQDSETDIDADDLSEDDLAALLLQKLDQLD
jgi:myxalamid-type polyketide synthase MxaE and MxaD